MKTHVFFLTFSSLAFRQFFDFFVFLIFGHFGTWIAEFSPQNLSPGRKFHAESDFRVKTKKFWRPGAKNEEKQHLKILFFLASESQADVELFLHFFCYWHFGLRSQNWDLRTRPQGGNLMQNPISGSKTSKFWRPRAKNEEKLIFWNVQQIQ